MFVSIFSFVSFRFVRFVSFRFVLFVRFVSLVAFCLSFSFWFHGVLPFSNIGFCFFLCFFGFLDFFRASSRPPKILTLKGLPARLPHELFKIGYELFKIGRVASPGAPFGIFREPVAPIFFYFSLFFCPVPRFFLPRSSLFLSVSLIFTFSFRYFRSFRSVLFVSFRVASFVSFVSFRSLRFVSSSFISICMAPEAGRTAGRCVSRGALK